LSEGADAQSLVDFVDRGGQVMFLPPSAPSGQEAFGVRWQSWTDEPDGVPIETWRGDQDLLANTQSGRSLPVGTLEIRRYCGMAGEFTQLATLRGGAPVLARVATNRGGVYFCATTPATGDSSLANNGVVLYVMIQRALMAGAAVLGNTRELIAGNPQDEQPGRWQPVGAVDDALSAEYAFQRGVYASGERLVAVNRAPAEDQAAILDDARVAGLFRGLDFSRVDDQAGNLSALIQEIWRIFLVTMIIALIVEAALCMPRVVRPAGGAA
jgi:hypothetical protein